MLDARPAWAAATLSLRDFRRLAAFVHQKLGIQLPPSKRLMVESRLRKRLRALELTGYGEYCDRVLEGRDPAELVHLFDQITTNKTDFFREPQHFAVLTGHCLPALRARGAGVRRPLRVWSAGCSTGEEPYTLAMVLAEQPELQAAEAGSGPRWSILATDISTRVLAHARRAVYAAHRVEPIPMPLRHKHLLRSRDPAEALVRIGPSLRERVRFQQLNFLDADYPLREPLDVIFCRNVFIYFDRPTQAEVLRRFHRHLSPGGYLFLGHSERITALDLPLQQVAPTVLMKV